MNEEGQLPIPSRRARGKMDGVWSPLAQLLEAGAVLESLGVCHVAAAEAGIPWTGDNPQQMSAQPLGAEPKVLDIENCAQAWCLSWSLMGGSWPCWPTLVLWSVAQLGKRGQNEELLCHWHEDPTR